MINFVGKKALVFTVPAVLSDGSLVKDFNFYRAIDGKNALLFFYPMDFTFVCPSELIAINNRINDFKSRNIEVIAVSVDSHYSHKAWTEASFETGGLGKVNYVLASDIKRDLSCAYGILDDTSGVSYRASFVIDVFGVIRVQHINDFPIGRSIDEYIRLFDALNFHKEYGYVCQAGWAKGDAGIKPSLDGISDFLKFNYKKL